MADADLLRRAAARLRDPYRCNSDRDVDLALAEVFDRAADALRELQFLANTARLSEPRLAHLADLLALRPVARAILGEPAEQPAPARRRHDLGELMEEPDLYPSSEGR